MNFSGKPSMSVPPKWKDNDRLAQKNGPRKTIISAKGNRYTGEWLENQRNGYGEQIWVNNGKQYKGDWIRDRRHGRGTLLMNGQIVYEGEWENDKMHGLGKYYYRETGDIFEGQWKDGKRCGKGEMRYADKSVYNGMWRDGKKCGFGIQTYANGNRYEGYWLEDVKHGEGSFLYITPHKRKYVGQWVNDVAKCGSLEDLPSEEDKETKTDPSDPFGVETRAKIPRVGVAEPQKIIDTQIALLTENNSIDAPLIKISQKQNEEEEISIDNDEE
eukprot:TRINITY_DN5009_c0_g1_i1.p1 TRINITY_DN5009_c0_g1~~TRINITY_DN5009_c0_g1_i1.p1  ORF type:complete len:272 (-),score=56.02 TRINITY_DN5009_c0_g1_i1:50-865(-)